MNPIFLRFIGILFIEIIGEVELGFDKSRLSSSSTYEDIRYG